MPVVSITDLPAYAPSTGGGVSGPLSELVNVAKTSNYRYPSDLGSLNGLNQKNHWVTFTIYDVQPATYETNNTNSIKLNGTLPTFASDVTSLATAASGIIKGVATLNPGQVAGGVVAGVVINSLSTTGLNVTQQVEKVGTTISLYMPDTLTQDYSASYDEMNLNGELGETITTLRAINSVAGGATGITDIKAGASEGNPLGTSPYAILVAQQLGEAGGVNLKNVGDLMLKAQGLAINPQVQMIYRGTGLRTFDLSFVFTPKSIDEATDVNNIINQFRFYASPSLASPGNPTNSMFLIPPSQFGVNFYINGQESKVLPKYGKCVLTSMDVNNSPNGFATYQDGSMVQTQLNLSFKELDILTRDYFVNDGINGDTRR